MTRHISCTPAFARLTNTSYVCAGLPLFQFTLLSFASMLGEITWLDTRLSITLTMLLTKVSYRFSMDEVLPRISYLTLIDKYYRACVNCGYRVGAC